MNLIIKIAKAILASVREQQAYWGGFFTATILGIAAWFISFNEIFKIGLQQATHIAVAIITALFCLFLFWSFRKIIFKKFFDTTSLTLTDTSRLVGQLLGAVMSKDSTLTAETTEKLGRNLAAIYSWASLYKWVFKTSISLIIGFAAIGGSLLIFKQNSIIEAQNNLDNLLLPSQLRPLLLSQKSNTTDYFNEYVDNEYDIAISYELKEVYGNPNPSQVKAILAFASNENTKKVLKNAMFALLQDQSGSVAIGAFKVLTGLGVKDFNGHTLIIKNTGDARIAVTNVNNLKLRTYKSNIDIQFSNCDNIELQSYSSYLKINSIDTKPVKITAHRSVIDCYFDVETFFDHTIKTHNITLQSSLVNFHTPSQKEISPKYDARQSAIIINGKSLTVRKNPGGKNSREIGFECSDLNLFKKPTFDLVCINKNNKKSAMNILLERNKKEL